MTGRTASQPRSRRSRSAAGALRYVAPLAVLWAVPVAVIALLEVPARSEEAQALAGEAPATAVVGERLRDMRIPVDVTVALAEPSTVLAASSGTVTGVDVAPGAVITSGMRLAEVDGVAVVAHTGPRPFYRDLAAGAKGPDVGQLNELLRVLGLPAAEGSDAFTSRTAEGVRQMQTALGASADGVFRVSYAWFVPPGLGVVGDVLIQTGQRLSDGSVVLAGGGHVMSGIVTAQDRAEALSSLSTQPVHLVIGDTPIEIDGLTLDVDEASAVRAAAVASGRAAETPAVDGSSADTVEIYRGMSVELRDPPRSGSVPRSALLTSGSGNLCVFVVPDGGDITSPEAVRIPPGEAGFEVVSALVPADLVGERVVVDPAQLPRDVVQACS